MNFTTDNTTIAFIILILAVLIQLVYLFYLNRKIDKFLIGSSSVDLDDSIKSINESIKNSEKFRDDMEVYLTSVEKRLRKSIQAIHTIRFNPFKGTGSGGNQSFATAFLNEDGNGVVVSSIYSREHTSVFSKPVKGNKSEFELSTEEKEALSEAKKII